MVVALSLVRSGGVRKVIKLSNVNKIWDKYKGPYYCDFLYWTHIHTQGKPETRRRKYEIEMIWYYVADVAPTIFDMGISKRHFLSRLWTSKTSSILFETSGDGKIGICVNQNVKYARRLPKTLYSFVPVWWIHSLKLTIYFMQNTLAKGNCTRKILFFLKL